MARRSAFTWSACRRMPGTESWRGPLATAQRGRKSPYMCCFNIPYLRDELRDAVKRVRRKPRIIKGFFQGQHFKSL